MNLRRWPDLRGGQTALAPAISLARRLHGRWRSSLQLRVVATTLVVSAVVVSLLGFFLMQQIAADLLQHAEASAYTQASDGLAFAQVQPWINTQPSLATDFPMTTLVKDLHSTGPGATTDYGVALTLAQNLNRYWYGADKNLKVPLPRDLAQRAGQTRLIFATLRYPTPASPPTTGLLYGAPLGYYKLYYFFPLTQLQSELSLILRTMILVGLALVFLLAGIAWLVTRWVVVPVTRAVRGAQSLARGNLDERLPVHGEDELAALSASFNEMAASLQDKMRELEELSQVQRQFVSDVSHELRTPLTTIRMAADLLFEARQELDSAAARSAELLQSQLERFEALLTDLLEISRYDANVATLDAEVADMGDLVRNSAEVAQQLAERRGARIVFRLPEFAGQRGRARRGRRCRGHLRRRQGRGGGGGAGLRRRACAGRGAPGV